jgi:hypothetical protein
MTDLLTKISSYNLFNNLFPGALFVFLSQQLDLVTIKEQNLVLLFFLFYFAGMTVSRIGSVIVEPIFKRLGIVRYASYSDYIEASSKDSKIELLLEANNTYRTIVSLFFCTSAFWVSEFVFGYLSGMAPLKTAFYFVLLILIYVFSYRKQTEFVRKRVQKICLKSKQE